ncbi:MAG: metal-dependent transcriptional regulator [Solirubrobacterales bacterium]
MPDENFFTFRESMKKNDELTAAKEDYLEMIFRLSRGAGFTRIHDLANRLNVQPPSATRMVQRLAALGYANYEKYGVVTLTEKGKAAGHQLLERHQTVEDFLRLLGISEGLLEETEKIEHTVSAPTLKGFAVLTRFFNDRPELKRELAELIRRK